MISRRRFTQTAAGLLVPFVAPKTVSAATFLQASAASNTETLAPDALLIQTNLTGAVTDIDESVDSPDSNWLVSVDDGLNTTMRVSFPTPTGDPTTGAGLQTMRLWVRRSQVAGGNSPTLAVNLWENGSDVSTLVTGQSITNLTGEMLTLTWDASSLSLATGADVEIYAVGSRSGGAGGDRRTVEFGAVEWNVEYD